MKSRHKNLNSVLGPYSQLAQSSNADIQTIAVDDVDVAL